MPISSGEFIAVRPYQTPKTLSRRSSSDREYNNNNNNNKFVPKSGYWIPGIRNFLKSESVQLLWSFCYSQMDQSERNKPFMLFQAIPGYYKNLYYGSYTSFEQSGLANSLISVTWM
ncbi:hypothetical protein DY000_02004869 [Brassica cretica]|uniref:UBX domain-containing protein n=1 Tax=Brassica cretica TaxID=69181 RepID=A0ABQ7CIW9_BRACR|nr:hypothetical protein DY000_02004869 [Brassica cretica]